MSLERKVQTYTCLMDYIKQKDEHQDYIDYYELFNLNKNQTIDELNKEIRRIRVLLHADQEQYIDQELKSVFQECQVELNNMIDVFSSEASKYKYDSMLDKVNKPTPNDNSDDSTNKNESYDDEKNKKDRDDNVKYEEDSSKNDDKENDISWVMKTTLETIILNHGFFNGYFALSNIKTGDDYSYIYMFDPKAESRLKKFFSYEISGKLFHDSYDGMNEYFFNLINEDSELLKEKANIFYNVCEETALEEINSPYGYNLVDAIKNYTYNHDYSGFSNRNGARDAFLLSGINGKDIDILIRAKLSSFGMGDMHKTESQRINIFSYAIKNKVQQSERRSKTV